MLILVFANTIAIMGSPNIALAAEPTKLKIYVGPASVPADNNTYECIFVQLQDSSSKPTRATEDTIISLSSSLTNIGVVEPTVTISKGSTFAVAKFNSTFTPGTTVIAAAASGYATVQMNLITVAPVPYKLAVYGFPPVLPSDGVPYNAIVVQLQDSSGNPAKAPLEGITVTLTSSNTTVASVVASAIISGGQTYTLTSITTTVDTGSAIITAQASGYASAQTTFTTKRPATTQPTKLKIYVAPPKTLAENTTQPQIIIQLLNDSGAITRAVTPIIVQLSSSNENVGKVQSTLEIPAGWVHLAAMFTATYRGGTATITAAATDLLTDTETITTIGPIPTKLTISCNPSALTADGATYNVIQVQLQDAGGKPAFDPDGPVIVSLFSSEPTVGTVPDTLTIPYGKTYATATYTPEYITGTTSITAQASGYATGQAQMKTYLIENFSLTAVVTSDPSTVVSSNQANITVYVVNQFGTPTRDAIVHFKPIANGSFTTVNSLGNGYYTTIFTAPYLYSTKNITITATVNRGTWANTTATTKLTVVTPIYYGTIQICVRDEAEQPIENATVSTLLKPSFMTTLTGMTNSSGFVTFANAGEGDYTFQASKTGYVPMNITFAFNNNSAVQTVYLGNQPADLTYIWIIAAVIAVIVVVGVIMWKYGVLARIQARIQARNKQPPTDESTTDKNS